MVTNYLIHEQLYLYIFIHRTTASSGSIETQPTFVYITESCSCFMKRQNPTCILLSRDLEVIAIAINGNLIEFFKRDKIPFQIPCRTDELGDGYLIPSFMNNISFISLSVRSAFSRFYQVY